MGDRIREKLSHSDVEAYKREVLEQSVLVAPAEVAKILSCGERKVYELVKSGELHGYQRNRGGRGLRVLASELRDYVQSIKIEPADWWE